MRATILTADEFIERTEPKRLECCRQGEESRRAAMKHSALSALFVITALVCVAPAAAKELTKVTLCGQHGDCTDITAADELREIPRGGAHSIPTPAVQPFYTMTLTIDHGGDSRPLLLYYLPREHLIAANGEKPGEMVWLPIADREGKEILRNASVGLNPFPRPSTWPRELKSDYRVIPDDQTPQALLPPSAASPAENEAAPVAEEDNGTSAMWLYALVVALVLAALVWLASTRRHGRLLSRF
jgi:hypothetical protein